MQQGEVQTLSQAKGYRATQAFELGEGILSKSDRKRPKPSRNQTSIGCLTYVGAYPGYTTYHQLL